MEKASQRSRGNRKGEASQEGRGNSANEASQNKKVTGDGKRTGGR